MVLGINAGVAATVSDAKRSMPVKTQIQTQPQPRVVIPSRTEVLSVDWVDTKNARIAIGGITYALVQALPNIVLPGGQRVTNIGYLKSGMQVRIRINTDNAAPARLVEITVVS